MMLHTVLDAAREFQAAALAALSRRLGTHGLDSQQRAAHGLAWIATSIAALEAVEGWLAGNGGRNPLDGKIAQLAFAETVAQLVGGLPMGQNEIVRPSDLGIEGAAEALREAVRGLLSCDQVTLRAHVAAALGDGLWPSETFHDQDLDAIREQYRRFTDAKIIPSAHGWHLSNPLIPEHIVADMAELGTFGVCIPEEYGGLGLGKLVMCLVTEELSRGWIGTGSLGTRSEIAGELIVLGGTAAQKAQWLPRIASGEILPTAVFTEPDTGSDLGSLATRARRDAEGGWLIDGAKTWITHAARSDLMTLLARTLPDARGYAGLSMLLIPKPRGTEEDAFPAQGMEGSEIEVLGYRGMREYALSFDGMRAPNDALLGGEEGQGFKQLMRTFEGARIQTAARAVGVARRALELGLDYAKNRTQFGRAIIGFPPRVGQDRHELGRIHHGPRAHLPGGPCQGSGQALRYRGRHGQAARREGGMEQCRRRAADPRRQRLCARVRDQSGALRRAHPEHLRRRSRNPGAGHCPRTARRTELMSEFDPWIGRQLSASDTIEAAVVARWCGTLDRDSPADGSAPQGMHWCVCLPEATTSSLGPDGHPRRDDRPDSFLPPVPLPRRMWASSSVEFHSPLSAGDRIRRTSRIASITEKSGGSGRLFFVEVEHETYAGERLGVRERQSIVYRDAAPRGTASVPPVVAAASFDETGWAAHRRITPDEPLLFRYSALTFNSHRIHYDMPYAVAEEGYRGLVVHGPLTATLLLDLASRTFGDNALKTFSFRGVSPAICNDVLHLVLRADGSAVTLGAFAADGRQIMKADASL